SPAAAPTAPPTAGSAFCQRWVKILDPMLGNIHTPHEPDTVFGQDIFDELTHRRGAGRLTGPASMKTNGHHSPAIAAIRLFHQEINGQLKRGEEVIRRGVAGGH